MADELRPCSAPAVEPQSGIEEKRKSKTRFPSKNAHGFVTGRFDRVLIRLERLEAKYRLARRVSRKGKLRREAQRGFE